MFYGHEDDDESMTSEFGTRYIIVRDKVKPDDLIFFLADFDETILNTCLWSRKKSNAHQFSKYNDADSVIRWLEKLKISARIETI